MNHRECARSRKPVHRGSFTCACVSRFKPPEHVTDSTLSRTHSRRRIAQTIHSRGGLSHQGGGRSSEKPLCAKCIHPLRYASSLALAVSTVSGRGGPTQLILTGTVGLLPHKESARFPEDVGKNWFLISFVFSSHGKCCNYYVQVG